MKNYNKKILWSKVKKNYIQKCHQFNIEWFGQIHSAPFGKESFMAVFVNRFMCLIKKSSLQNNFIELYKAMKCCQLIRIKKN